MTHNEKIVAEILARRALATPGDWYVDECCGEPMVATRLGAGKPGPIACASWVENRMVEGLKPGDAAFIANAPRDIDNLLAIVASLTHVAKDTERRLSAVEAERDELKARAR